MSPRFEIRRSGRGNHRGSKVRNFPGWITAGYEWCFTTVGFKVCHLSQWSKWTISPLQQKLNKVQNQLSISYSIWICLRIEHPKNPQVNWQIIILVVYPIFRHTHIEWTKFRDVFPTGWIPTFASIPSRYSDEKSSFPHLWRWTNSVFNTRIPVTLLRSHHIHRVAFSYGEPLRRQHVGDLLMDPWHVPGSILMAKLWKDA